MSNLFSDLEFEQAVAWQKDLTFGERSIDGVILRYSCPDKADSGSSYSLEFDDNTANKAEREAIILLKKMLGNRCDEKSKILVVGIGNGRMTSDSLGTAVVNRLADLQADIKVFLPSVEGLTGISSHSLVRCAVKEGGYQLVIAVDSLCALSYHRIGKVIQMTERGLFAGSALGRGQEYSESSLGVPVIAIGVPVVVSLAGIFSEYFKKNPPSSILENLVVAPKDVDRVVLNAAKQITNVIQGALS